MKILDQCEEARTIFIQDRLYVTEAEAKEEEEEEEEKSTISYRDEFFLVEGLAHTLLKYIGGVADIQRYFQELARGNSLNGEEFWLIGESLKAVIKVSCTYKFSTELTTTLFFVMRRFQVLNSD